MRRNIRSYRGLTSAERKALRSAWLLTLLAQVGLRFVKLPRIVGVIDSMEAKTAADLPPQRLAELVEIAGRRLPKRSTCLHRSLALMVLLRRRGQSARLMIGVKRGDAFEAHAWVHVSDAFRLPGHPADGAFTPLSL